MRVRGAVVWGCDVVVGEVCVGASGRVVGAVAAPET